MTRIKPIFLSTGRIFPNHWDLIAFILIFSVFAGMIEGSREMSLDLQRPEAHLPLSLDYWMLPYYALRTALRMIFAMGLSVLFTFLYAPLAARSRHAEMILIPFLDILQSVPILGFLSFIVPFFLGLFPGSLLGAECAAIFAIFTSQAWNMAFSFYHSLRTIPQDLEDVAHSFRLSAWQKFWQLETPFALPGLIWNMMISMSGGWFFVVASEAITVGDTTLKLPGLGSYLATAIEQKRVDAVLAAVGVMLSVILLYDQLFFRPMVAWSDKFRMETISSKGRPRSWVLSLFQRTYLFRALFRMPKEGLHRLALLRFQTSLLRKGMGDISPRMARGLEGMWGAILAFLVLWGASQIFLYSLPYLSWNDIVESFGLTGVTFLRVAVFLFLATLIWVPLGVVIGLNPTLAKLLQPAAQFLAAFPANVVFPLVVVGILHFHLNPDIWLSFLVIFGTQWYIAFNVIAGADAFPHDLREAAASLRVRGKIWWKSVILPGIFPYYITGAITAWGGSWNATVVAEYVRWGDDKVVAHGIGAYIAQAAETGDYPRIVLGMAMMSFVILIFNRLLWKPLLILSEGRLRLG